MILYIAKSGLCLALLLVFYHLVLEREKMHRFNRFYLLGSVLFSFLAPLFIIYIEAQPELIQMIPNTNATAFPVNESVTIVTPIDQSIDFTTYLLYAYITVCGILLIRFGKSLFDIVRKTFVNDIVKHEKAKIVLVNDNILPHSFWNYIFINKEEYEAKKVETELFTHELTHVTQRHTIDVLLIEALQVVFWINPFFFLLKKAIQLNHEFLADDKVIASHKNIPKYQHLLLDKAAWKNKYYLASNLNYSLTKKRLLMMKKHNSKSTILLKKLAIVPLLTGLVFLFADRVEAQSKEVVEVVEVPVASSEATPEQMDTYKYLLKITETTKLYEMEDIGKMRYIRAQMSDDQKKSVKNVDDLLPHPQIPTRISAKNFEKIKNAKKFAVWIDGKSINNKELEKYSSKDFYSYFKSFVHENARSKSHPQDYQVSLYTEDYFKNNILLKPKDPKSKMVLKEHVNGGPYPISAKTYEKIKNSKLFTVKIDGKKVRNSVLKKYTAKDFVNHTILRPMPNSKYPKPKVIYSLMTEAYYQKYKKKYANIPPPPKPVKIEVVEVATSASESQMKEYKKFETFFSSNVKNKVIKVTDFKRVQHIYKSMSSSQKKSVKHYSDFLPPPPKPERIEVIEVQKKLPPPPPRKNGYEEEEIEEIEEVEEIEERPEIEEIEEKEILVKDLKEVSEVIEEREVVDVLEEREVIDELEEREVIDELEEVQEDPKFHKGWYITIDGQRYYYTFDRKERIARYYKNGKFVNLDIIKEYKKKHKIFEKLKKNGKHYVFKSKKDKRKIDQEFSDLGGMYFRMSRKQKNAVPYPNNPRKPYLKLVKKDGTVYYKKRAELTDEDQGNIPPPPPTILKPGTSKEDIKKARKAYDEWAKRLKLIKKDQ
ncbi:MAG: M56 family metallopeptidase [Flavobacteriaceae bacterium]